MSRAYAPDKMKLRFHDSWKQSSLLLTHYMHANINLMAVRADHVLDTLSVDAMWVFEGAPRTSRNSSMGPETC